MLKLIKKIFKKSKKEEPQTNNDSVLMSDATLSLLIQCDIEGNFTIFFHENNLSHENADVLASILCMLNTGYLKDTLLESLETYPQNEEEQEFCQNAITLYNKYEEEMLKQVNQYLSTISGSQKRKIDPTKIFSLGGIPHGK